MPRYIVFALLVLAPVTSAQYPIGAVGFFWQGATTLSNGTFCWGATCTPYMTGITANETVTLTVRGDFGMPYVVAIAPSATRCLTFPNAYNSLILDDPITVLFQGALDQLSPILACPSGFDRIQVTFPPVVPPGTTFSLQAAAVWSAGGSAQLAFTTAFDVTVQ